MYYITDHGRFHMADASIKPRVDISDVLQKRGFKPLGIPLFGSFSKQQIDQINKNNLSKLKKDDIVIWQYPIYINDPFYLESTFINTIHEHHAKVVALLHDVDYLRGWQDTPPKALKLFDGIISTSRALTTEIRSWGVITPIVEMAPFAFRTDVNQPTHYSKKVSYCGSIYKGKAPFLESVDFDLDLYGESRIKPDWSKYVHYKGSVTNEYLLNNLNEGFGLIWDGERNNKERNLGTYLKYNYPYKLSLYIACNLPIICIKGTNVGNYVEKYKLGFTVDKLESIKSKLDKVDLLTYSRYLMNIHDERQGVVQGLNVVKAVYEIIQYIDKNNYIVPPYDVSHSSVHGRTIIIAK